MKYISGKILTRKGFKKGFMNISDENISKIEFGDCPTTPDYKGFITPSFINMHTHLGDAFIAQKNITLPRDIMKLVAPPDGIKHQLLKKSSDDEIITGMKVAMQTMISTGTNGFVDFRENGERGINCLKMALDYSPISSYILSRPQRLQYDPSEIQTLLELSDGIGLSSISDWNFDDLQNIVSDVKKRKKIFSLHVSERIREDIDKVISLEPDFIIHMTTASKKDFMKVKDADIPIIVCPRSNLFFRMTPPLQLMKEAGNMILFGTDNAMLYSPNIIDELHCVHQLFPGLFTTEELLHMVTYYPRKVLNLEEDMHDATFPSSTYVILHEETLQPLIQRILIRDG